MNEVGCGLIGCGLLVSRGAVIGPVELGKVRALWPVG